MYHKSLVMAEATQEIFTEARKGKYSSINNELSQDDVTSIWDNVSEFIERQMLNQKAVNLSGLGIFTFMQNKLDIGNNKFVLIQRPVFQLSERFSQNHGIQYTKYHVPGTIPVVPLNYTSVSLESPFPRETIETCVKEILSSLSRAVASKKNVELSFTGIGRLIIRDNRVKMRFLKDFITQLDGSGTMMDSMCNRPGTMDSVMSLESATGRHSANTVLLPIKQHHFPNGPALTPVPEILVNNATNEADDAHSDDHELTAAPVKPNGDFDDVRERPMSAAVSEVGDPATDDAIRNIMRACDDLHRLYDKHSGEGDNLLAVPNGDELQPSSRKLADVPCKPSSRSLSRETMPLPKASGVNITEDVIMPTISKLSVRESRLSKSSPAPLNVTLDAPDTMRKPRTPPHLAPLRTPKTPPIDKNLSNRIGPVKDSTLLMDRLTTPQDGTKMADDSVVKSVTGDVDIADNPGHDVSSPECGHTNAGQELCYLCHQRARRNVPVSLAAERKRQQDEEDRAISQYRSLRDTEQMLKEQEAQMARKNECQKQAAFNLGVAEGKKVKSAPEPYKSFIFQQRTLTPHRSCKQKEYGDDILKQCDEREKKRKMMAEDTRLLELMEQAQLANDLAREREEAAKDKMDNQMMYKRALDTQVKLKPMPIPLHRDDTEFFGKNDMTEQKLEDRHRIARNLMKEQQDLIERRKRDAILKCLTNQKEELKVLDDTKRQMQADGSQRHAARVASRKICEKDWESAAELKRARHLEDKLHDLEPFIPLHEQCRQYRRCDQCQRHTKNTGKWNIWCDTRYIPGTTLMV